MTCITIAQFTGTGYICFGNVKQNGVTSLCLSPELEKLVGNGLDCLNTTSTFHIPHTWWGRHLAGVGKNYPPKMPGGAETQARSPGGQVAKAGPFPPPPLAPKPMPGLTPHCNLLAKIFTLTSEVQPEGRRLASSIIASIISEWFLGLLFTLLSGRENKSSNWSTPISTIYPRLHI